MRDCFELVDISLYLVGIAMILPAVQAIGRESVWLTVVLILLLVPVPIYLARFKYVFPERIDSAFEKFAVLTFFTGLIVTLGVGVKILLRWITSL